MPLMNCWRGRALAWSLALMSAPALAQFAMVPAPLPAPLSVSTADSEQAYRGDAARHLYAAYPMRIFKGKLPPLLYGVAMTETEVDADGQVVEVRITRPPAAPEVAPWIRQMIRRAAPFPPPTRLGRAVYVDIWLVHKSGQFQLDTLTEGQH